MKKILILLWFLFAALAMGTAYQRRVIVAAEDMIRAQVKVILMLCARACDPEVIEVCESVNPPARYAPEKEVY